MSTPSLEGFEIPLHRALTEPILLGGAPRALAIVNGTVAAAVGIGLQLWLAGLADGGRGFPRVHLTAPLEEGHLPAGDNAGVGVLFVVHGCSHGRSPSLPFQ